MFMIIRISDLDLNECKSFKPRSYERGVFLCINILFAKYTPIGYNTFTGITDKPQ